VRIAPGARRTLFCATRGGRLRLVREPGRGLVGRAGSAGGWDREPVPVRAVYVPPRLRAVGTLAELVRGAAGVSDGLGPGSALEGGAIPPPGAP